MREERIPRIDFAEFLRSNALIDHVHSSGLDGHFRVIWYRVHRRTNQKIVQPIAIDIAGSNSVTEVSSHLLPSDVTGIRHVRGKEDNL